MKTNIEVAISLSCSDNDYKDFEHKSYESYVNYSGEGEGRHFYRTIGSGEVTFPIDGFAENGIRILSVYGTTGFEFIWDSNDSGSSLACDALFVIIDSGIGFNDLIFRSLDPTGTKLNLLYGGDSIII